MKIFGYKTADDESMFASTTLQGFTLAETHDLACEIFGVEHPNGYNIVAELTLEQFEKELARRESMEDQRDRLYEQGHRIDDVINDMDEIADELGLG